MFCPKCGQELPETGDCPACEQPRPEFVATPEKSNADGTAAGCLTGFVLGVTAVVGSLVSAVTGGCVGLSRADNYIHAHPYDHVFSLERYLDGLVSGAVVGLLVFLGLYFSFVVAISLWRVKASGRRVHTTRPT
jgi:hypothetical protein